MSRGSNLLTIRDPAKYNRPKTFSEKQLKVMVAKDRDTLEDIKLDLAEELEGEAGIEIVRPKTRGDCVSVPRPCPYVSCKYHLYLDPDPDRGSIKFNFPDKDPDELSESCSLDIADRGGITLREVATILRLTRERVRQIEAEVLRMSGLARKIRKIVA